MLEKLFNNPGEKIKKIALTIFWIEFIGGSITALIFTLIGILESGIVLVLLLPITIIISLGIAWLSSILLYGFGELISNSVCLYEINNKIKQTGKNPSNTTESMISAEEKNMSFVTASDIKERNIPFAPSKVFKNVMGTASSYRSPQQIKGCLESALEILKDPVEKKYVSIVLSLSDEEIKEFVNDLNRKFQ